MVVQGMGLYKGANFEMCDPHIVSSKGYTSIYKELATRMQFLAPKQNFAIWLLLCFLCHAPSYWLL